MEVRIDSAEGQDTGADVFLSLRIGDVQKQSRFLNSRTFRFPSEIAEGKGIYGRIEVFKRIGHATVSFDDIGTDEFRMVKVPFHQEKLQSENLDLKLHVNNGTKSSEGPQTPKKVTDTDRREKLKTRMDAAQKYLAEHKLEELLAQTMREVIHEKPDDPRRFIAEKLVGKDQLVGAAPPPVVTSAPPPAPALPTEFNFGEYYRANCRAVPADDLQGLYAKFATTAMKSSASSATAKVDEKPAAAPSEFKTYYVTHIKTVPSLDFLYARFGQAPQSISAQPAAAMAAKAPEAVPVSFQQRPSVGNAALGNFGDYYHANCRTLDVKALQSLYAKFEQGPPPLAARNPLVKTEPPKELPKSLPTIDCSVANKGGFQLKPSVGSWLQLKPVFGASKPSAKPEVAAAPAKAATAVNFGEYYRANCRTVPRDALRGLYAKFATTATKSSASSATAKVDEKPAAAPSEFKTYYVTHIKTVPSLDFLYARFGQAPQSISAQPAAAMAAKAPEAVPVPFQQRPSVGSWLQPRPPTATATEATAPAKAVPVATTAALGNFGDYCRANCRTVPADALQELYAKFATTATKSSASFATAKVDEKPAAAPSEFKTYYVTHIKTVPSLDFLYARFGQAPQSISAQPAAAMAAKAPEAVPVPFQQRPSVGSWLQPRPPTAATEATAPAKAVPVATTAALGNFGDYYRANCRTVPADALQGLYAKFATTATKSSASPATAKVDEKPAAAPSDFKTYYVTHIITVPSLDFLYARFGQAPQSISAQPAAAMAAKAPEAVPVPFQQRPSVGSWLQPRPPTATATEATAPAKAVPMASTAALGNFGDYYRANCRTVPADALQGLYAKFATTATKSSASRVDEKPTEAPSDFKIYYVTHIKTVQLDFLYARFGQAPKSLSATKSSASPATAKEATVWPSSLDNFGQYYQAHFCILGADAMDALYSQFPSTAGNTNNNSSNNNNTGNNDFKSTTSLTDRKPVSNLVPSIISGCVKSDAVVIKDHAQAVELVEAFKEEIDKKDATIRDLKQQLESLGQTMA
ncbi:unnamed protein product [Polarella glacialis]|uniref:Uncharacterized protein n=2 Tax=Polarella glacialis TaxID=89957 RepID=A0A813GGF7_POLGL|nr:unnamed protein product [Polarella glacialis]